ncbi:MAG: nuclear transport factor 2 family protein [Gemmatimonadota bacterium]|nr:nuclear transport factor 2 family protein [Gemmatimonadota bacterium]
MKRSLNAALALLIGAASFAPALVAQDRAEDERAVLATLERLFDAMRANDAEMAGSVFADGAVLISTERQGRPATNIVPAESFVAAIGNATAEWDEPFWDPIVQIQDHLATVWTKYAFYLDGEFTHCGVDAVIMARGEEGWKIAALADSRETEECELPPPAG